MTNPNMFLDIDTDPIDTVEALAHRHKWNFDRPAEDQIAIAIKGQWRTYSVTIAWSGFDETLRMVCTFEMQPPDDRMEPLHTLLNLVNDQCWAGSFTFWEERQLMVYRYGLILAGKQHATAAQIETMINAAVLSSERFYPAFQLLTWGGKTPKQSIEAAIAEAYGRA